MKICVVGVGYVGLVTAGCLAEAGNDVVCVDNNSEKIVGLKSGVIPIYESGLTEIVKRNERLGRLRFTTELKSGVDNSLIIFLAVGTPSLPDGSADISAILSVASDIGENLNEYRIIATPSFIPISSISHLQKRRHPSGAFMSCRSALKCIISPVFIPKLTFIAISSL